MKDNLTAHPYTATPIREGYVHVDDSNLIQNDDEFTVALGPDYVDPEAYGSYICAVANDFRTMHVVALNGKDDPVFQVLDDEGVPIHPFYPTLNLAIIAAKGWLS